MCKRSKADAKSLIDRTKSLDTRGNVGVNTQAESTWAVETLTKLDDDSVELVSKDLKRVYDGTKTSKSASKFRKGYKNFFGDDGKGSPSTQDLVGLMLESEYDFKEAVDGLNSKQKGVNKPLWEQCRTAPEFADRGREQGRKRQNSFLNPHAGIADHYFRQEVTENFFGKEVSHAKGVFQADPKSDTYKRFAEQGAPFVGGVSGTMQGLTMAWELDRPLGKINDDEERETERARREKLAGIYMATLLAGGHHSASEMLFSAKSYGLFPGVEDPLKNYPLAMKQLGDRFTELGLPGDLSPKPGAIWRAATKAVVDGIAKLDSEITDTYKNEAYSGKLEAQVKKTIDNKMAGFFSEELAAQLDTLTALVADKDKKARETAVDKAATLIVAAQKKLDDALIGALDENPFVTLTIRKTISTALDQVSALVR